MSDSDINLVVYTEQLHLEIPYFQSSKQCLKLILRKGFHVHLNKKIESYKFLSNSKLFSC